MFSTSVRCQSSILKQKLNISKGEFSKFQLNLINTLAQQMKADLKQTLSIPVEVFEGKKIRSTDGQAPRMETGNLRDSIQTKVQTSGKKIMLQAGVLTNKAPYAFYLEYGTQYIKPRPYLMPTLRKYSQILKNKLPEVKDLLL